MFSENEIKRNKMKLNENKMFFSFIKINLKKKKNKKRKFGKSFIIFILFFVYDSF